MDVRVRALTLSEPRNCLQDETGRPCAVYTENWIDVMALSTAVVKLSKGSTVERESASELKLVRGLVKIKAETKTVVKTLYGSLELSHGEVLIESRDSVVKFTNLSSDLQYSPKGESTRHKLPIGFSTYFAGITKSGVAETGYPRPAEIEQLIKDWGKFYLRTEKSQFASELKSFMPNWQKATQQIGQIYVSTVKREIAAQEAEEAYQARLKAAREAENNKYRHMFQKRIFNEW